FGEVFSGFPHGFSSVEFFHFRIDKAPSETAVIHFLIGGKSAFTFGNNIRPARHSFHTTGNEKIAFIGFYGSCCLNNRTHSGSTKPVDGFSRNRHRKSGE